ncbi:MAG: DNA helicase RecG, partial [Prochloraceae cyanobacterium]
MIETTIDWGRLEKALEVEIKRNFINLKGKQYYFHEFFCNVFSERPPIKASEEDAKRWRSFAVSFASYPLLREDQRQYLVYSVQTFLRQLKSSLEKPQIPQFNPNFKLVDTSIQPTPRLQVKLNDRLQTIREIGAYRAKRLDKLLDLCTVKDALFYYPRDYVDYSRQVNIADLVAG